MFYNITNDGSRNPVWSHCSADEVLLHCARIGYNP